LFVQPVILFHGLPTRRQIRLKKASMWFRLFPGPKYRLNTFVAEPELF